MTVQGVVGNALVVLGALLVATAAVGMLRLPDVYNRANAVTKAASLGVVCVLLGVLVLAPSPAALVTVGLAVLVQLVTVPIAGYALGGAAYAGGAPLAAATHRDELADADRPEFPDGGPG
ncbi:MAG TPA: monovalent cation/H(+) antiporter subunit G [Pseudonocardia sp.]|jgi:multicomponent Na+:H+ antiporter subunit G|nr:monovalent cation/H(+) antiporter subunit G [Pseudonocardia sp.]